MRWVIKRKLNFQCGEDDLEVMAQRVKCRLCNAVSIKLEIAKILWQPELCHGGLRLYFTEKSAILKLLV